MAGSWESLCQDQNLAQKFDVILTSETLYNIEYYPSLFALIKHCLAPDGYVLVGTKTLYFGLGGGFYETQIYLENNKQQLNGLKSETITAINDKKSIERLLLKFSYTEQDDMTNNQN